MNWPRWQLETPYFDCRALERIKWERWNKVDLARALCVRWEQLCCVLAGVYVQLCESGECDGVLFLLCVLCVHMCETGECDGVVFLLCVHLCVCVWRVWMWFAPPMCTSQTNKDEVLYTQRSERWFGEWSGQMFAPYWVSWTDVFSIFNQSDARGDATRLQNQGHPLIFTVCHLWRWCEMIAEPGTLCMYQIKREVHRTSDPSVNACKIYWVKRRRA